MLEHEIKCLCTKYSFQSIEFVFRNDLVRGRAGNFMLGQELDGAHAQNILAQARTKSCSSTRFHARARSVFLSMKTPCSSTNISYSSRKKNDFRSLWYTIILTVVTVPFNYSKTSNNCALEMHLMVSDRCSIVLR